MKYLRVKPDCLEETSTSYIIIKEEENEIKKLPDNWTLEFFINYKISENNNNDLSLFDFITKDKSNNIHKIISLYISKNDENKLKIILNNENTVINEPILINKWNHIAVVYAGDTSLIVYVNAQAIISINNPNKILTNYNTFDKFLFTSYKQTNTVLFAKIKLYEGILYNENNFSINYPFDQTSETSIENPISHLTIIYPPENAKEDTILPIIKNATYTTDNITSAFKLEFGNKNNILEDTGGGFKSYNNSHVMIRDIGYSNEDWDAKNGLTNPELPDNPEGLEIIDAEKEGIYYEIYDVKYQMPTVLKSTSNNEIAIWKDIDSDDMLEGMSLMPLDLYELMENKIRDYHYPKTRGIIIDILTNDSFLSKENPLFAGFELHDDYKESEYNATQSSKVKAFPINIHWDDENKNYTNPENIPMFNGIHGKLSFDLKISGIADLDYNKNIDKINNDEKRLYHFRLEISDVFASGKIDGVDTKYITNNISFSNSTNTEDIEDKYGSSPSCSFNNMMSSSYGYTSMVWTLSNWDWRRTITRLFFYLHKDKYYALFRFSKGKFRGFPISFDSSIYLFDYPHNFKINKGHNSDIFLYSQGHRYYKQIINYLFNKHNLNLYIYTHHNSVLYFPSNRYPDINFQEYDIEDDIIYTSVDNKDEQYDIPPLYRESILYNNNNMPFISKKNINQFNKQIITDLSPKKNYSCFVKEFDSTKEIGVIQSSSMVTQYDSSFKFVNNQIIAAGINIDEIYKTVNTYGDNYIIPVGVITTSYTKERNILKFRNYHPLDMSTWYISFQVYFHINNNLDDNYYDVMYLSGLMGYGFVGFQVQPSTGLIRVITNTYYPYSTNISKMEQIMKDKRTTILNTTKSIKKNKWNSIALINGASTTYYDDIFNSISDSLTGLGLITDNDTISISAYQIPYLHRVFFFMKSLNSSIVPIFTDIWLSN